MTSSLNNSLKNLKTEVPILKFIFMNTILKVQNVLNYY